jgi:hypothetical protein
MQANTPLWRRVLQRCYLRSPCRRDAGLSVWDWLVWDTHGTQVEPDAAELAAISVHCKVSVHDSKIDDRDLVARGVQYREGGRHPGHVAG